MRGSYPTMSRSKPWLLLLSTAFVLLALVPSSGLAQDIVQAEDGVYTDLQARRGLVIYRAACADCHGERDFSGTSFMRRWGNVPIGAFFQHVKTTMPDMAPGILTDQQTADIMAYVLSLNGFPAGDDELPSAYEALGRIRMDRPDER